MEKSLKQINITCLHMFVYIEQVLVYDRLIKIYFILSKKVKVISISVEMKEFELSLAKLPLNKQRRNGRQFKVKKFI